MKKYILLVVTALILTGLAGCSMTKTDITIMEL